MDNNNVKMKYKEDIGGWFIAIDLFFPLTFNEKGRGTG